MISSGAGSDLEHLSELPVVGFISLRTRGVYFGRDTQVSAEVTPIGDGALSHQYSRAASSLARVLMLVPTLLSAAWLNLSD